MSRTPCRRINKNLVEIIRFKKKKKIQKRLGVVWKRGEGGEKKEKTEYPSTDTARSLMHQSFRLFALSRAIPPCDLSIPPTCLPPLPPSFCHSIRARPRAIVDYCTSPFLSDIRFPNISLLLPTPPTRRFGVRCTGISFPADVFGMYRSA